ncbi:hypothetical protein [Rummeliibacillus stabekisii]|uniref:hypothetical protein n=1 Tax=Rummeliibacillus stabekisii TaxID=241244 RepID=UPI00371B9FBA
MHSLYHVGFHISGQYYNLLLRSNLSIAIIAAIAIIPYIGGTSAKATAGWQSIGEDKVYVGHDLWAKDSTSKTIYSGGGNVRVCGYGDNSGATTKVYVQETDEAGNAPENVISFENNFYNQCKSFSVDKYVDGSNKKAELQFHFARTDIFQSAKWVNFTFYD